MNPHIQGLVRALEEACATLDNEQGTGTPPSPGWLFNPGTDAWGNCGATLAETYTVASTEVRGRWAWWRGIRRYGAHDAPLGSLAAIAPTARAGMVTADADRLARTTP